ncbi:unnamed protein product [Heterobilharzia americana]|nr:unnamed protein product [Heterobilharzia americana]
MSCRRRSRRYSSQLDDRLLDDYRNNYRRSRSSRAYPTTNAYDPYYSRPPSTYRPVAPISPGAYPTTNAYDPYYSRPPSTYRPVAPISPGPYPCAPAYDPYYSYAPSTYRPPESVYRGSVREAYEPRSVSPYPVRRALSSDPSIEPDEISRNGNTISYSPHPRPKVDIYHEVPGYNMYQY